MITASTARLSPGFTRMALTIPSRSARNTFSIFIASITATVAPRSTASPTDTLTSMMRPGIGATTFTEYRGIFEKDAALSRRFQKVDVAEPGVIDVGKPEALPINLYLRRDAGGELVGTLGAVIHQQARRLERMADHRHRLRDTAMGVHVDRLDALARDHDLAAQVLKLVVVMGPEHRL